MALRIQRNHHWSDPQVTALITIRARTNDQYWYSEYGKEYNIMISKIKTKYYY